MSKNKALLIDFDGTAATTNVGMALIEKFAKDDSWRIIDDDYETGKVGSLGAYELIAPLLTGGPDEWRDFVLGSHSLDPHLITLVKLTLDAGWRVEILSDGLDFYIKELLAPEEIDLPMRSALLKHTDGVATIETPFINLACKKCGTCKSTRVDELTAAGEEVIFVGDGLSDRCAAPRAKRIFAKDDLARHLDEYAVKYESFDTLYDVAEALFRTRPDGR